MAEPQLTERIKINPRPDERPRIGRWIEVEDTTRGLVQVTLRYRDNLYDENGAPREGARMLHMTQAEWCALCDWWAINRWTEETDAAPVITATVTADPRTTVTTGNSDPGISR